MSTVIDDMTKHREINFCSLHPPEQAQHAILVLSDIQGVENLRLGNRYQLHISYDIRHISLQIIEDALQEIGFHLDNSLLFKLKRALHYYTEDVQRHNLGVGEKGSQNTRQIFINRYQRLRHGCRDDRPDHWRKYL